MIVQLTEFAKNYPPIISFILTTIGTIAIYFIKPKVSIIWGLKSHFTHVMRPKVDGQNPVSVSTASFTIQNNGRLPASEIEVVFNYEPDEISIWPQRQYTPVKNNENRHILIVKFLGAKEAMDVSLICVGREVPELLNVKSPQVTGKFVSISYIRQYPRWLLIGLWTFVFLGFVFAIEKTIRYLL